MHGEGKGVAIQYWGVVRKPHRQTILLDIICLVQLIVDVEQFTREHMQTQCIKKVCSVVRYHDCVTLYSLK